MRKSNLFLACALVLTVSGCSWFSNKKPLTAAEPAPTPFIQYGKVIDDAPFAQGGKVVMVPFQAGAGVVADEELDKAALMIVKGFAETLALENTGLEVVLNEDADRADFIVEGRITEFSNAGAWKKWFGKKKIVLGINGKIKMRGTQKTLVAFSDSKELEVDKIDYAQLSFQVGQNLAKYLSVKLKEKPAYRQAGSSL